MAFFPGMGGAPVLMMAIRAKDETGGAFKSVRKKTVNLGATVARAAGSVGTLMTQFATLGRITGLLSNQQARLLGLIGTLAHALATTYYVAKSIATAITWAHNVALTWEVALMTLGVGVAIAAGAAIAILATQTREATDAQVGYNRALDEGLQTQERYASRRKHMVRRGQETEVL